MTKELQAYQQSQGLSQTLNQSSSANNLFSKVPRGSSMNSMAETHKNITIKKILQEMEKDLN